MIKQDNDGIIIERMLGGISRKAYKVLLDNKENKYLARISSIESIEINNNDEKNLPNYKKDENKDLKKELYENIMTLKTPSESSFFKFFSLEKFGPKFLGEFSYFCEFEKKMKIIRFEKFMEGRQIFQEEIIQDKFLYKIPALIGKIHSFYELENSDERNYIYKKLNNKNILKYFVEKCDPDLYSNQEDKEFVKEIKILAQEYNINKIFNLLTNKKQFLSHNDIWVGNIFIKSPKFNENKLKRLLLIDLESIYYNINGYDLGKYLYETMIRRNPNSIKHYLIKDGFPENFKIRNFLLIYILSFNINKIFKQKNYENNEDYLNKINSKLEFNTLINYVTQCEINENYFSCSENSKEFFENIKDFLINCEFFENYDLLNDEIDKLEKECYIGIIISCYWLIIICVICGKNYSDQINGFISICQR